MNLKHPVYIVSFMVLWAALFGAAVTGLHIGTKGILRRNEALLRERALVSVFALGDVTRLSQAQIHDLVAHQIVTERRVRDPQTGWETELIEAYADPGRSRPVGHAFRFRGLGFWAPIEGILALTPEGDRTLGLVILRHSETPGLGGRVEEPVFTDQFRRGLQARAAGTDARILALGTAPPNPAAPDYDRTIQAITGATQTSVAVERMLNDYLARFNRAMAAGPRPAAVPEGVN